VDDGRNFVLFVWFDEVELLYASDESSLVLCVKDSVWRLRVLLYLLFGSREFAGISGFVDVSCGVVGVVRR
jgi:hypothetical protein